MQFSIIFITCKITNKQVNKRENRAYDMHVSYTKNNIENKFVDYLGPINVNSMPLYLKKSILNNVKINYEFKKKTIVNWFFTKLV